MIDQFWLAVGVVIAAATALFAGYWKLSSWIRSSQNDYVDDVASIEAKIRSSRLVPQILQLFADLSRDQSTGPNTDPNAILSREEYASKIRAIADIHNEISNAKKLYAELKTSLFALARSLLYLGVVTLLTLPLFYFCPSGLPIVDELATATIIYSFVVVLTVFLLPALMKQDKMRRAFSDAYDQIVIG